MRTANDLLLTFLLNSVWQGALVVCAALLCARMLRGAPARYRHALWVSALALVFALPVFTTLFLSRADFAQAHAPSATQAQAYAPAFTQTEAPARSLPAAPVNLNAWLVTFVLALYILFLSYRAVKLLRAWNRTRLIRGGVRPLESAEPLGAILARAQRVFGVAGARVVSSDKVSVPVTVGFLKPLVILPEGLLLEADADVLTSAVGHELAHVARHDYLFNLVYEVIFLPISFHPAAALARRRIVETRELVCDELVAERLLEPEVYARTLVQMAGSAVPFGRRAGTVSVGINDADILEVRIMSLLRRTGSRVRGRKAWLIALVALLAVPCVAAGSLAFATRFTVESSGAAVGLVQEPVTRQEPSAEEKAKREARAKEERVYTEQREPLSKEEMEERSRREHEEMEVRDKRQAELARAAKISMDQAIQIATSQHPGKVLECSLIGERWKEPGKLAGDAQVVYHVVILSGEGDDLVRTHVLVNAVDGTIFKTEFEKRRKEADKEQP